MSRLRPSGCRKESAREFRCRRAVWLMERGESPIVIARVLGVSIASVYKWHKMFLARGELKTKPPSGRPRKLSNEQIEALRELLKQGATTHGWSNELWTSDRVAVVIRRHFNVTYSHSEAWIVLTRYLGWTNQRPVQRSAERNEELIDRWKTNELPRILKEIQQRGAHLVFLDETGFLLAPTVCRTFAPRGQPPAIKVSDPHGRISAIGAISISPTRKHLKFLHELLPDNANFCADSVVRFVSVVCRRLSGPITFVCDACPIHCTKLMRTFLDQHPSVEIEEFPPYAPELNPVARAWGYLKHGRLANYAPCSLIELRKSLKSEFCALKRSQEVIAWCIRKPGLGSALA